MLPVQRQQQILEDIERQGVGVISELSKRYGVSEMTIRRDLSVLEERNRIKRTRGGAIPVRAANVEPQYAVKQTINAVQKEKLARYAAEHLVEDGDIVILEGGTTVTTMVPHLRHARDLTVITNGLYTTLELQKLLPDLTVISTGGILREVSSTFVGPVVEEFFRKFHVNKAFLSTTGFVCDKGFTDPSMLETQAKTAMIGAADELIVLLDSSKFGVKSLVTVMDVATPDIVVTDADAPQEMLDTLRAEDVQVFVIQ